MTAPARAAPALLAAGVTAAIGALALPAQGFEPHTNVAGSVQLDYLYVPTRERARDIAFDGFTTELSLKAIVDFGERASAHVKVCYGCHGFEVAMAYVDLWLLDGLSVRAGRMNPRFGDFELRHDPANHRANSKPLPYDMGRMLRRTEWNNGILPIPYADNGVEVYGTLPLGDAGSLDYAAHVVAGLRGGAEALDIDFVQSRSPSLYYVDNNGEPSWGGRLALTVHWGDGISTSLGGSFLRGPYDPDGELSYAIAGADLHVRIHALALRAEVLRRWTDFAIPDDPTALRFDPGDRAIDFFVKDGFYVELEYPLLAQLEIFARWDGLRRFGNLPATSPLRRESAVLRYTAGGNIVLQRGLRLKLSAELWDFSDFAEELGVHVGFVGNF